MIAFILGKSEFLNYMASLAEASANFLAASASAAAFAAASSS